MNWLEKKILLHYLKSYLGKASTMKLSWNLVFQAIAMAAQYGNQAMDVAPAKWKPGVALAIGILQTIVAWRAHYSNPDGTPSQVAYIPQKEK